MANSESRIEKAPALTIAGLRAHFTNETWSGIPEQWQRLASHLGEISGQVGRVAYGLCFNKPSGVDYLSGIQISDANASLPAGFSISIIPAQTYLIFPHHAHVSQLHQALEEIERQKLPASGHKTVAPAEGAPNFFERYGEGFNPSTGQGDIEVWIPIQATPSKQSLRAVIF